MIRITQLLAKTVPLQAEMSNALIDFSSMTGSVVALVAQGNGTSDQAVGFGFSGIGRYAQTEMILERFAPRLLQSDPTGYCDESGYPDPLRLQSILRQNEKPGGHGERCVAVGAIDMAAWDLAAKLKEKPLYELLSERFEQGSPQGYAKVYAAGGYYHAAGGLDRLRDELSGYLETGYRTVKIKIGGASLAEDLKRIEAAIEVVGDPVRVAVDANGRFHADEAIAWGNAIEPYGLCWYEEAGDPLDFELQRNLAQSYPHPLATGENLFSNPDVRNLIRYSGMRPDRDILQMDPVLGYGLPEYLSMLDEIRRSGWTNRSCYAHGGHLFCLHAAVGLDLGGTEAYPGVFAPFGGFGESVEIKDGRASPPDLPGIGWETKPELMAHFLALLQDHGIGA
jgi:L-alanine-DL-glutamate epimerase-like enolase superfamily enzyme